MITRIVTFFKKPFTGNDIGKITAQINTLFFEPITGFATTATACIPKIPRVLRRISVINYIPICAYNTFTQAPTVKIDVGSVI